MLTKRISWQWKSQQNKKHKLKKSSAVWNAQRISSAINQDSRTFAGQRFFKKLSWSSVSMNVRNYANSVFILGLGIFVSVLFGDILLRTLTDKHPHC